eukprot:952091-Karenia_brevis.AAC.1
MRKTGDDNKGEVVQWLQRKHLAHVWEEAHKVYCTTQPEALVPLARFRDRLSRRFSTTNKRLKDAREDPIEL